MENEKEPIIPDYSLQEKFMSSKKKYLSSLKAEEIRVYKKLAFNIALTILILIIISYLGIPFVNVLGGFWQAVNGRDKPASTQTSSSPLIKPRIEPIPVAVNTNNLEVKGYTSPSVTIKGTLNNANLADTISDSDGEFTFSSVKLKEGLNKLTFKAVGTNGQESDEEVIEVTLDKKPPKLEISNPPDNAKYGANLKELAVVGTSEGDAIVSINDFQAIVSKEGSFTFSLPLKGGVNKIKITAKDLALNQTTIERTVQSDLPIEATISAQSAQ